MNNNDTKRPTLSILAYDAESVTTISDTVEMDLDLLPVLQSRVAGHTLVSMLARSLVLNFLKCIVYYAQADREEVERVLDSPMLFVVEHNGERIMMGALDRDGLSMPVDEFVGLIDETDSIPEDMRHLFTPETKETR